jgi:hypothetical protein
MYSFNGIGTKVYGKREENPDGSYIVTKWFIIIFFPIIPLGSYRVIKEKQKFLSAKFPRYQMTEAKLNVKQVLNTYLAWWSILILLILLAIIYK